MPRWRGALDAAQLHAFNIIILDVMMPFMDGLEVTRRLRRESIRTPILLLTARDAPEDVVRGLDSGADDYLTKPFSFDVLVARVRARTRSAPRDGQRLRFADLLLDPDTHEVWRGKRQITLTRTEFALLESLIRAAGRVVSRETLIEQVWGGPRGVAQQPGGVCPLPSGKSRSRRRESAHPHRSRSGLQPSEC